MRLARFILLSACGLLVFKASAALAPRMSVDSSRLQKSNAIIVVKPDQKPATLGDFAWLAGRWVGRLPAPGSDKQLTAEQQWMSPKNGTMQGFFRLTDNEKTIVIELFTIRETPDGIAFYFRHFSPE